MFSSSFSVCFEDLRIFTGRSASGSTLRKHSTVTQDNAQELCAARRDLSCRGHAAQCAASVVRKGWDSLARSHRLALIRSDLLVAILHAREPETESNDPVDAMHVCLVETTTCASRRGIGRHVRHPLMVGEGRMRDPQMCAVGRHIGAGDARKGAIRARFALSSARPLSISPQPNKKSWPFFALPPAPFRNAPFFFLVISLLPAYIHALLRSISPC
jgi:hypothetical protein